MNNKLRITEIFYSLQGETRTVGLPTVFVRLTGCPLRCGYCDTAYAFHDGQTKSLAEVMATVAGFKPRYVCVTGGEPLAQKSCIELLKLLCDQNYKVSLETSGALSIADVDARVMKVLDLKTPGSKECDKNLYENLAYLTSKDQIKFVLCDRADYDWAKELLLSRKLFSICEVLFSPSYQQLSATDLANWILADRLPVRLQIQLHKYLWGDVAGK
jgi:7-carboxy-7-deazaguanine synthase